jgi:predicted amidohydrolase YtcJ
VVVVVRSAYAARTWIRKSSIARCACSIATWVQANCLRRLLDERIGSIEPGKLADLIVLSQNLFEVPAIQISETKVKLTIVGGKIVWRAQP